MLDDIIVTGQTKEKYLENLDKVFKILSETGLKIKLSKREFFKKEIAYLGNIITEHGLKKCENKVKTILDAPAPENVTQVKAFAGMVNYYARFLPNISILMKPIYELFTKNKQFKWSRECRIAFDKAKYLVVSDKVLVHFNQTHRMRAFLDVYRIL